MHRYGSLEKVMPVSHPGPLSNPFPRIAEVQTKATKMMELLQLSYNTSVLGIRGFTGEKAKLGVGGTLWSLIQAGYRLLYSIRPIHSGEWTCKRKGANTDPVGKGAEQWTVSRRPMEDPKRSRRGMGRYQSVYHSVCWSWWLNSTSSLLLPSFCSSITRL